MLAGFLDPLLDREPSLFGLAVAEPDPAVAVSHDHERGEGEAPSALHDLGDPVDPDRPLFELTVQHRQSSSPSLRAASASGGDAPVVAEATAVEHDRGDPGGLGALGDGLAYGRRRRDVARRFDPKDFSSVEAAARVRPVVSSTTWARMWRAERKTLRRGRSGVPDDALADAGMAADAAARACGLLLKP